MCGRWFKGNVSEDGVCQTCFVSEEYTAESIRRLRKMLNMDRVNITPVFKTLCEAEPAFVGQDVFAAGFTQEMCWKQRWERRHGNRFTKG